MDALQLIATLTENQIKSLFRAVDLIPADKMDWKPSPESRSVLDQLQELSTVFSGVPDAVRKRKLEMNPEDWAKYEQERKKIATREDAEAKLREGTVKFLEFVRTVPAEELEDKMEMPWPGDFRVYDMLTYHYWNMSYHEGQIYYIATLLGKTQ